MQLKLQLMQLVYAGCGERERERQEVRAQDKMEERRSLLGSLTLLQ